MMKSMNVNILLFFVSLSIPTMKCAELSIEYIEPARNVSSSAASSLEEMEKAANDGINLSAQSQACLGLGEAYYYGRGYSQNYEKARGYFEKASKIEINGRNQLTAFFYLGKIYSIGQWSGRIRRWGEMTGAAEQAKNYGMAKAFFDKLAQQEDEPVLQARAWLELGNMFSEGRCVPMNGETALAFFKKAAFQKADGTVAKSAQDRLTAITGTDYFSHAVASPSPVEKTSVTSTPQLAVVVLPVAPPSEKVISVPELFEKGCQLWRANNFSEAVKCLEQVIEQTDDSKLRARSWIILGTLYFLISSASAADKDRGLSYLMGAEEQGPDIDTRAEAAWYLGKIYYRGIWVQKDYAKALGYLLKAGNQLTLTPAIKGSAQACLIEIYYKGLGVEKSYQEVRKYCELAEQVSASKTAQVIAWFYLGELYSDGLAVNKDEEKARLYWIKAAEQGLEQCWEDEVQKKTAADARVQACLRLYNSYYHKKNLVMAEKYFAKVGGQKEPTKAYIEGAMVLAKEYKEMAHRNPDYLQKAKTYYTLAAQQKVDLTVSAQGWFELGCLHYEDTSVRDASKFVNSRDCFEKASQQELAPDVCAEACLKLANLYAYSTYLKQDRDRAKECYEKIIRLNAASARLHLEAWTGLYNLNLNRQGGPDSLQNRELEDILYTLQKSMGIDSLLVRQRSAKR